MNELLALWNGMEPTLQLSLAGIVAGGILWGVQRVWTNVWWLPMLGPDDTARKKFGASLLAAALTAAAVYQKTGDWQTAVGVLLTAWTAGQALHLRVSNVVPAKPAPDPMQSTVDDN